MKLGELYRRLGRYEDARGAFESALKLVPADDFLLRAKSYCRLGSLESLHRNEAGLVALDAADAALGGWCDSSGLCGSSER